MSDETRVDDVVERLVRLAESGPAIPADGAARIKTAVGPLWRKEVATRARFRRLVWSASALAAAAALTVAIRIIPRSEPSPLVPRAVARFENGPEIAAGSWIRTNENRTAIRLSGGQSLRVDRNTNVRLVSARVAELDRGAIYIDSGSVHTLPLEVRTRLGVVRDIGTQFEVRSEQSLTIRVREGRVSLSMGTEMLEVTGGGAVTVAPDGSRVTTTIPADAQEWEWVQSVAPPFAIEGRTVAEFLQWVERETGLSVGYESAAAEELARTAVLHGTLGDLHPAQASEVLLPTAGLRVTREGRVLKIDLIKGGRR